MICRVICWEPSRQGGPQLRVFVAATAIVVAWLSASSDILATSSKLIQTGAFEQLLTSGVEDQSCHALARSQVREGSEQDTPRCQHPWQSGGGQATAGQTVRTDAAAGITSAGVDAQASTDNVVGVLTGRPTIAAQRITQPPSIDGRLDEPVWQTAGRIINFVQQRPLEGAPASEQTEVYVAYDSSNLYFGLYAHYSDPGLVRANRVDRDQTTLDDRITFYLDPFLDQQRAFLFSVNGYGVQGDAIVGVRDQGTGSGRGRSGGGPGGGPGGGGPSSGPTGSEAPTGDPSWDALFSSAGTLVDDGWTAEVAIPFKSLRYPQRGEGEMHRWGFQIVRTIESKDESDVWASISRDVAGFLSQMGILEGMTGLSLSRNLEIMPTAIAIQGSSRETTTGQFVNHNTAQGGANIKYGLTSNLTLDFTYNPDFSQIETDRPQIEVNQRFPLNYPELRPFFLEGQEIFNIPGPPTHRPVQTRTIVDPQYGAKLTGKIGRTAIGVLIANDEAPGNVDDRNDPVFGKTAQVMLARVRYDLYSESNVGVLVTNREFLDGHSRLAGLDGSLRIGRTHQVSFFALGTNHRDLEGVDRKGHMVEANIRRQGRNLSYFLAHYQISPDFRADTGFIRRVDYKNTTANMSYRWWPESWIINWGPRVNYRLNHDFDDVKQDEQMGMSMDVRFAKSIDVNASVNRDMERFHGIDFWKTRYTFTGDVRTSRRISIGAHVDVGDQIYFEDNPYLGSGANLGLQATLRPTSRLQSEITLDTSRFVDMRGETDEKIFDVKIWRAFTTYQFTERLLLRNIMEYNTFDKRLLANILATYRVNAGTVFFVGYDARYDQGNRLDEQLFLDITRLLRTNHAIFTKLQYLFRF